MTCCDHVMDETGKGFDTFYEKTLVSGQGCRTLFEKKHASKVWARRQMTFLGIIKVEGRSTLHYCSVAQGSSATQVPMSQCDHLHT